MSEKDLLDDLINDFLKTVVHGELLKAIHLANDILVVYPKKEILKNLSPQSRQQTGLIQWAQNYFMEQKEITTEGEE